ncbi:MAG: hypothetical protein QW812_06435, partial [Thermoplasmataceae archaeon]
MLEKEDRERIVSVLRKYYDIAEVKWDLQSVTVKVPDFRIAGEEVFIRASEELERLGFISFTNRGVEDEIIVTEARQAGENKIIKILLLFLTIGAISYYGYIYQTEYSGDGSILYNIGASLIFYVVP